MDDNVDASDAPTPSAPLLECEILAGLSTWFERLFEGSLRRYHVSDWPQSPIHPS